MLRLVTPADQPALEVLLSQHAASTMFLRSNIRASGVSDGAAPYHGAYAAWIGGGQATDVAAHYWNNNLILFAPTAAAELATFITNHTKRDVSGILGPWAHCLAALDALNLRHRAVDLQPEHLFSLGLDVLAFSPDKTNYRRAQSSDIDVLVKWRIDYEIETLGYAPGPDVNVRAHEAITRMIASGDVWVALQDGAPVSMSAINARLPDMVQVGGVHTPKHLRGRGYARIAVAGSLRDCKSEGASSAILFTEARNISAKKVYAALGFQQIGDYGLVLLK
jgi:uncharacterized protein